MWNFLTSDIQIEESVQKIKDEKPKEALKSSKTKFKNRRPQSHRITKNLKKKQLQEDRDLQIYKENQILLKKMINIDTKPSTIGNFRLSSARIKLSSTSKNQEQFKIFNENQRFLKRLQSANSHYSIAKFEQENKYRQYLKSNISKKNKKIPPKIPKVNNNHILIDQILKRREHRKVQSNLVVNNNEE
jgi:Hemingway/CFA97